MTVATDYPEVYIASLAAYNNAILYGTWIVLDGKDADDIQAEVTEMLKGCPEHGEEWAIHDHSGFAGIRVSEYESWETLIAWAAGIAEHGEAFAAWVRNDPSNEDPELFGRQFKGEFADVGEYAQDYWEQCNENLENLIGDLAYHIDWDSYGEDFTNDLTVLDAPGGRVFIFDTSED